MKMVSITQLWKKKLLIEIDQQSYKIVWQLWVKKKNHYLCEKNEGPK
jgi:hypothetical protein